MTGPQQTALVSLITLAVLALAIVATARYDLLGEDRAVGVPPP